MTTTVRRQPITTTQTTTRDPQVMKAWGAITIGMLVASFAIIFVRAALNANMPPLLTAAGRLGLAFVILTPLVMRRYTVELKAMTRAQWLMGLFAGFWMCLHFSLIALSLENTRIAVTQVLVNTSPLIVAMLETIFLRARLPRVVWVGLLLAIVGGGIIGVDGLLATSPLFITAPESLGFAATHTGDPALGVLFAIVSAFGAATYLTTGRKARASVSLIPYMWILTGAGAVTGAFFLLGTGTQVTGHSAEAYFWMLMLALGPQLITHSAMNYAVAYIPATIVTISAQFVTVSSAVIAFLLFAEMLTPVELIGAIIIISGVMFAIIGQSRRIAR